MFERFTNEARDVVEEAIDHAEREKRGPISTGHLLLAVTNSATPAGEILRRHGLEPSVVMSHLHDRRPNHESDSRSLAWLGIDLESVRGAIENHLGRDALRVFDSPSSTRESRRRITRGAKKALELSLRESIRLRSGDIGADHIFIALCRLPESTAGAIIRASDVSTGPILAELETRVRNAAA